MHTHIFTHTCIYHKYTEKGERKREREHLVNNVKIILKKLVGKKAIRTLVWEIESITKKLNIKTEKYETINLMTNT